MIEVNGKRYNTLIDAANFLKVSSKSVRDYIKKGIIPKPKKIQQGLRTISIFPKEYLEKASKMIDDYVKRGK